MSRKKKSSSNRQVQQKQRSAPTARAEKRRRKRQRQRARRAGAGHAVDWEIPQMSNALVHHARQVSPGASMPQASRTTTKGIDLFPQFDAFVKQLANPFAHPPAQCPMSYNPAPTFRTNVGRTTVTISNFKVSANTTYTFNMMPGWNECQSAYRTAIAPPPAGYAYLSSVTVEPVANICSGFVDSSANQYLAAPFNLTDTVTGSPYLAACITGGVAKNASGATQQGYWNFMNVDAWDWDSVLPYTGNAGDPGSLRWRCTGCSVRVENSTQGNFRGGTIWSVQPTYGVTSIADTASGASTPIGTLAQEPSIREWGVGSKPVMISAMLKPKDLSYWSCYPHSTIVRGGYVGTNRTHNPVISLALDAGAQDQTYNLQFEYHWEFAGNALQTIMGEAPHLPETKNAFEPATSHAVNTAPTAEHVPALAKVMEHVNVGKAAEALDHPVVKSALKSAAAAPIVSGLLTKVASHIPRVLGHMARSAVSALEG